MGDTTLPANHQTAQSAFGGHQLTASWPTLEAPQVEISTVFPAMSTLNEPVAKGTGCCYLKVSKAVCGTFILPNELVEDASDYGIKSTLNGPLHNYKPKQKQL